MAGAVKARRPKPECPKGFRDDFGSDVSERRSMLARIAGIFELHGFDPLETPAVETVEALGKFLPDTDRPNEGVFAWKDEDQWLALRYDLTAPLSRVAAQYRNVLASPYRRYAIGPVWRNEKPGPGRYRQFYQCDADTVGSSSMAADAEMCVLAAEVLESVGMSSEDYRIRINSRKVLDGVLETAGILNPEIAGEQERQRLVTLRAIDKLDRLGPGGVRQLLGRGRRDASGDYTKGAELSDSQADAVLGFLSASGPDPASILNNLRDHVGESKRGNSGIDELEQIMDLVCARGRIADRCAIDPSVVRGLGYYTGPVVEAELCFNVSDAKGRPQQFGSVAGGGRYDGLVRRFTGQDVPATGLSIGVDRLLAAMKSRAPAERRAGPVIVTVMDPEQMSSYQDMAAELREAGIRAEVFLGNARNFGRQMKYADRRDAPVAVIEGSEERRSGTVQLKDLALGRRIAETATQAEWKARPSQIEVPRTDIVAEIRRLLADG